MSEQEQNVSQLGEKTDLEIAELASKEISERDKKIRELEKQLAKSKLMSNPDEEPEIVRTKEDCLKTIFDSKVSNYDYAVAVCDLVDIETKAGRPNPLGKDGDAVYDFLDDCIACCDGDKSKFPSVYQAKIGKDDLPAAIRSKRR